ncbi:hypothetical protein BV20DRAFT_1050707 [Pilatotrama ljubarskyi]|nr:hypothetical protein BV20DRAFT_1050707 [Pilatotrama ljubarskyi]
MAPDSFIFYDGAPFFNKRQVSAGDVTVVNITYDPQRCSPQGVLLDSDMLPSPGKSLMLVLTPEPGSRTPQYFSPVPPCTATTRLFTEKAHYREAIFMSSSFNRPPPPPSSQPKGQALDPKGGPSSTSLSRLAGSGTGVVREGASVPESRARPSRKNRLAHAAPSSSCHPQVPSAHSVQAVDVPAIKESTPATNNSQRLRDLSSQDFYDTARHLVSFLDSDADDEQSEPEAGTHERSGPDRLKVVQEENGTWDINGSKRVRHGPSIPEKRKYTE